MSDEEFIEVDGDHPWVQAASLMEPQPVRTQIGIFPHEIDIETEEGNKKADAAMVQVVTATGVTSVFIPPQAVVQLFQQCQQVLEFWEQQAATSKKLVVATPDMERAAKNHADSVTEAGKLFRGLS
jgi:hypothetical protein